MKIGELIAQLEALKAQRGNLNVVAYGGGEDANPEPMEGDGDEWPPHIDHIVIRG